MIKLLKRIGFVLLSLISAVGIYIYASTPRLPKNSNTIINELLKAELPEYVSGKSGTVMNDSINIWYESISPADSSRGVVLLFMGISNDALAWPKPFIDAFVDAGYRVIRYDYRGTGLSDWLENWQKRPYALEDLARDARVILDTLKIEKANLVGLSMGGMVAQEFAIHFPYRTHTLTSIMSSGNILDSDIAPISTKIVFQLLKASLRYGLLPGEKNTLKQQLAYRIILRGDATYPIDVKGTSSQVLYNLRQRKGLNRNASAQHHEATYRSGSRHGQLKDLKMPVLIMHGVNDPFIPIDHSQKLAETIPHARTKWIDNMAHDIPVSLMDTICKEIIITMNMETKRKNQTEL
jgi:pimeloyl-ACP methyl ester carboxylesterase